MERENFKSRLGFILVSAGCAIGIGNVWRFPYVAGQNGGGLFVLLYLIFLVLMGVPVLTMELAVGRASRKSAVLAYKKLEKPKSKWHIHGWFCMLGCYLLMMYYTTVSGWMTSYFYKFATGSFESGMTSEQVGGVFNELQSNPLEMVIWMAIITVLGFLVCSRGIQKGIEKVSKVMMIALLILILVLAGNSLFLSGAGEGLSFYLIPDLDKVNEIGLGNDISAAMNQAFFSLSTGMGGMAIFGSYIGKDRSLMGEAINVISLDTLVALLAGIIIFPACFTYNLEVNSGPNLLFDTMATVFNNMPGGRIWGSLFFLFMVFAAMSTVLGVCENILAMIRDLTGWSRRKGSLICGIVVFVLALTTALGFSVLQFQPFAEATTWLDFWDFIVSTNVLPLGSLVLALFCCNKFGWGWDNFIKEANMGIGMKVRSWMKPIFKYVVPTAIAFIYVYGLVTFKWR